MNKESEPKPKKGESLLTLSLRNSIEIKPKKPLVPLFDKEKLNTCFEAIKTIDPKALKKSLSSIVAPDVVYEGYEKSLLDAQEITWQSIQRELSSSQKKIKSQEILSILLFQKAKQNDWAKK
jgi:hypothetical protein